MLVSLASPFYIYILATYIYISLLLCNCACSLEFSSLSTLAGLSYHICGKLEVALKASPSSQHQHCTDEAQKAETVLSAYIYIYIYIYICVCVYVCMYVCIYICVYVL